MPTTEPEKKRKKRRVRGAVSRTVMKVDFIRHWYIKRTLKTIDKAKEKGRRLPPEYAEMTKALAKVPKAKRAQFIEESMQAGEVDETEMSRAMRRAVGNQGRQSGRGGGRTRPGLPPGAMQQGKRQR
jgi:hypothetical protein